MSRGGPVGKCPTLCFFFKLLVGSRLSRKLARKKRELEFVVYANEVSRGWAPKFHILGLF